MVAESKFDAIKTARHIKSYADGFISRKEYPCTLTKYFSENNISDESSEVIEEVIYKTCLSKECTPNQVISYCFYQAGLQEADSTTKTHKNSWLACLQQITLTSPMEYLEDMSEKPNTERALGLIMDIWTENRSEFLQKLYRLNQSCQQEWHDSSLMPS